MSSKYYTCIFKSFKNGYYTFVFEDGLEMVFEEIHPKILLKYDLKNDSKLRGNLFHLYFSEYMSDDEVDFVIYRIEYLELINNK
ncbi:hypothetical protein LCM02_05100 [Lutimonas saemankumensis]|uniref:hypothetical protein n=1 Tax=Lutimonas saemankumensis TaxID=483016 RepID=UPI001CD2B1CF|nr:hypothetical protein [Lutimonas saemankumensis]MCA0931820.1 hypothetical protein [Lutimonas saemankumensis]